MSEPLDPEVAILNAALELPAEARAAYLDDACARSGALRQRVEMLLQSHEQAEGFLEGPPAGLGFKRTALMNVPLVEKPGDCIGRYRLLQQIGEGGCGVVYMAEQEEPVRRRVALKVIKLGMDTKQVIARFEAERQALAMMDHPNIAKVYDAGSTERPLARPSGTPSSSGSEGPANSQPSALNPQLTAGRPYFVMELVRGVKITDYCDENNISTEGRLKLFIQVCQAIQHAHQKGVIHRDIKPSNVLVTVNDGVPVPKVIDFGIAKATQGRLTDQTLFTAFEQFIGTPAYMSPEQAVMTSLDIDTRSDIYSLGVLLYELLTGRTPFDEKELLAAGLDEMRRTICEKEPVKPSTSLTQTLVAADVSPLKSPGSSEGKVRADSRRLQQEVRGDLDWIVMKCLEKDRRRRYETANGLARDIERHLRDEPVTARPPSALYQFRKLVQRNRLMFAGVGVFAVALLIVAIGSTIATWRVAGARRAEQGERQKAETANRQLRQTVSLLELERAEDFFVAHDSAAGVAHLAAMLRRDPSNAVAAHRLISALIHRQWALPVSAPMRHADRVVAATFSPDGRRVLSASWDSTARLWDAATGQIIATLQHGDRVTCAQLSPKGDRIVTASFDGTVQIWNATNGAALPPPLRHESRVYWAEFSADSRWIVTASADRTARIWDASSGAVKREFRVRISHVVLARFSPDGQRVATGGSHGSVRLWNVDSGEVLFHLEDRGKPLTALVFSPDGRQLLVACDDGIVRLWNTDTGATIGERMVHRKPVWHAAFSPDGKWLLTACEDGAARLWDALTTRALGEPLRHESGVIFGGFSPDGHSIVTTSSDNTARMWDARTGTPLWQPLRHIERVLHASFSPDGRRIATASYDGASQVWELRECQEPGLEIHHDVNVDPFAFAPDGAAILTAGHDKTARLWDGRTGEALCEPLRHDCLPLAGDIAPDGRKVVLACGDGTVRIWDCGNGNAPRVVADSIRHGKAVRSVRFSADGSRIVTASADGTARVWNAMNSQPVTEPLVHHGDVVMAQFSRDGRLVVTASEDRTARVWDAQSGRPVTEPLAHIDHVHWAEFSPDGARVVTASTDNMAGIWDAHTGRIVVPPLPHPRMVRRAVFSPDGRRVATASLDRMARIWDAHSGQSLTPPLRHDSFVELVQFNSDGGRLVTVSRSGLARFWDTNTGRPLTEWLNAGTYWGACFDPVTERVAVGARDGVVHLWKMPWAPTPVPEWFPAFAEAVAGIRLAESGALELAPGQKKLKEFAKQIPSGATSNEYEQLAWWFLAAAQKP